METVVVEITVCDKPCIIFYDFRPNSHALSKAFDFMVCPCFSPLGVSHSFPKGGGGSVEGWKKKENKLYYVGRHPRLRRRTATPNPTTKPSPCLSFGVSAGL